VKAAAREEAARTKATSAMQVAEANLTKATQQSLKAAQRRAALLPRSLGAVVAERIGGHQAQAWEGGESSASEEFAFPTSQPGTQHSQFAPYRAPFQHSSTPPQVQRPFFYGPTSPISPFPQIDVPLTSMLYSLQFPSPYQLPTSHAQSSPFWSTANQGGGE
jgi:hypothetical protein